MAKKEVKQPTFAEIQKYESKKVLNVPKTFEQQVMERFDYLEELIGCQKQPTNQ